MNKSSMADTFPKHLNVLTCEYIWVDADGGYRSKNRVLYIDSTAENLNPKNLPIWNYDGSSTGQAITNESEVILVPAAVYKDPFLDLKGMPTRSATSILVLCETFKTDGTPHPTNTRHAANELFDKHKDLKPWYGIEQEFFLSNIETGRPLGFPIHCQHFPKEQGTYYCGAGGECVFGRDFVLDAYKRCLLAGLTISGMNGEVAPGQWEIQVGPCEGIRAADQLSILRYILTRTSELYPNISVEFFSKPVNGLEWNGSGAHTNFSTEKMRNPRGLGEIYRVVENLKQNHSEHIKLYGEDNHLRLTGKCETSDMSTFTSGVGDRSASIRIPTQVEKDKCGYFEDRRPSSSCDPYVVTSVLLTASID
jgi:glutamine synthetase